MKKVIDFVAGLLAAFVFGFMIGGFAAIVVFGYKIMAWALGC